MEYIIVGKIVNTHGVKGELRIQPLTDSVDRFKDLEDVFVGEDKEEKTIKRYRPHKSFALLTFEEHDDINEVLRYKESYIYIDKEDRLDLPEDKFYIDELLDMEVYDMEDDYIGIIIDIIQASSNDVYVIKKADGGEAMVPAVKEFVKAIDIENGRMDIDPIEGMI